MAVSFREGKFWPPIWWLTQRLKHHGGDPLPNYWFSMVNNAKIRFLRGKGWFSEHVFFWFFSPVSFRGDIWFQLIWSLKHLLANSITIMNIKEQSFLDSIPQDPLWNFLYETHGVLYSQADNTIFGTPWTFGVYQSMLRATNRSFWLKGCGFDVNLFEPPFP